MGQPFDDPRDPERYRYPVEPGGPDFPPPSPPLSHEPPPLAPPAAGLPGAPVVVGGGGGGGFGGNGARPIFNFRNAPEFTPPVWNAPTMQDAMNEPGYQFRLEGGSDALERSAAARGVLRTGGTLKDVLEYGQNFATQEYGNVFNRALQGYDRDYRGAYDAFLPRFDEWKFLSGAEQAAAMAQFSAANHGGGGGGNNYAQDKALEPGDPGPPLAYNNWYKPGNTDVQDWLDWQNQHGQQSY